MIILLIILAVIAIILLIPVRLEIVYNKYEIENKASVLVKYAFIKYRAYPKKEKRKKRKSKKTEDAQNPENTEEIEEAGSPKEKEPFSFEKKKAELDKYIKLFSAVKHDVVKLLSYTANHAVIIDKITFNSEFGFEDAMQTGIFTGIYNGFVYSVIGVIHHNSHLRAMDIKLQPVFGKKCFNYRFSCISHIKTVHIIIIAFKGLILLRKIKKLMNGVA